jgi:hypothetical protein
MKSTLCLCILALMTTAITGCMVEPESTPQPSETDESAVSSAEADESLGETQQALDANCQERSCVSCGPGKLQVKTVSHTKQGSGGGTWLCNAPITTTYGPCLTYCAL